TRRFKFVIAESLLPKLARRRHGLFCLMLSDLGDDQSSFRSQVMAPTYSETTGINSFVGLIQRLNFTFLSLIKAASAGDSLTIYSKSSFTSSNSSSAICFVRLSTLAHLLHPVTYI